MRGKILSGYADLAVALSGTNRERISRNFGELAEGVRITGPLTDSGGCAIDSLG